MVKTTKTKKAEKTDESRDSECGSACGNECCNSGSDGHECGGSCEGDSYASSCGCDSGYGCDSEKEEKSNFGTRMYTSKVMNVIKENYRVTTLQLTHHMPEAKPGQFIMVWIPDLGERPMSIGCESPLTISVANVGEVSAKISSLKKGDLISYRGPFGNGFSIPRGAKRILVIGGGYGVVPTYFLARFAQRYGFETIAVIGARTGKDIIYEKQLYSVCKEVFVTTDDGTHGKKGTVMSEVDHLVESKKFDYVYCCGPERMMEAVANVCRIHRVPCQISIERYMKCGVGVCGSCAIDGKLTCVDGPVFSGEEALSMKEFGKPHRDESGKMKG